MILSWFSASSNTETFETIMTVGQQCNHNRSSATITTVQIIMSGLPQDQGYVSSKWGPSFLFKVQDLIIRNHSSHILSTGYYSEDPSQGKGHSQCPKDSSLSSSSPYTDTTDSWTHRWDTL